MCSSMHGTRQLVCWLTTFLYTTSAGERIGDLEGRCRIITRQNGRLVELLWASIREFDGGIDSFYVLQLNRPSIKGHIVVRVRKANILSLCFFFSPALDQNFVEAWPRENGSRVKPGPSTIMIRIPFPTFFLGVGEGGRLICKSQDMANMMGSQHKCHLRWFVLSAALCGANLGTYPCDPYWLYTNVEKCRASCDLFDLRM